MNRQRRGFTGSDRLNFCHDIIGNNGLQHFLQSWKPDGNIFVLKEPFQVLQCKWNAGNEMRLAFKQPTDPIRTKGLKHPYQYESIIIVEEFLLVQFPVQTGIGLVKIIPYQFISPIIRHLRPGLPKQ